MQGLPNAGYEDRLGLYYRPTWESSRCGTRRGKDRVKFVCRLRRSGMPYVGRLGIASIRQFRWQYGFVPEDMDRSLAPIDLADLLRLAALAADAEAGLFERNPHGSGRYADRLLGRALCQGAALHYVNGQNGVKDFRRVVLLRPA
jgi:hypothetical protein